MNKYKVVYAAALIWMVLVTLVLINNGKVNKALENTEHQYETLQICDSERESGEMTTCYVLEDKYNVEYICAVMSQATKCAVEIK